MYLGLSPDENGWHVPAPVPAAGGGSRHHGSPGSCTSIPNPETAMRPLLTLALVGPLLLAGAFSCSRSAADSDDAAPAVSPAPPEITGAEWRLVELDDKRAATGMGGRAATLKLSAGDNSVTGFLGCNSMGGSFEMAGDSLRFGQLASTRMACPEGLALERQYAAALEATRNYRVTDGALELLGDRGVLARFERP
jgi:heat shock protein HslJ